jgi:hypothetical protein
MNNQCHNISTCRSSMGSRIPPSSKIKCEIHTDKGNKGEDQALESEGGGGGGGDHLELTRGVKACKNNT